MVFGWKGCAIGACALALASTLPALGRDAVHVLNVVLPNGQVEQIGYRGALPPHIVMVPVAASPLMELARMSAIMDRQMDAMMQQAAAFSRVTPALLTQMPQGAGATYMASFSSDGACTRSTQITFAPGMARPQEVSSMTGSCGAAHAAPMTTQVRDDETQKPVLRDALWREVDEGQ